MHLQPNYVRAPPKFAKDVMNRERLDAFDIVERNMDVRKGKYQTSADLLLENKYDEYL